MRCYFLALVPGTSFPVRFIVLLLLKTVQVLFPGRFSHLFAPSKIPLVLPEFCVF